MQDHWTAALAGEARFAVRVEMPTTAGEVPSVVLRLRAALNPCDVRIHVPPTRTLALFVRLARALDAVELQPDALDAEATDILRVVRGMTGELAGYADAERAQDSVGVSPFARTLEDAQVRIALGLSSGAEIAVAVSFVDACEILRVLSFAVVAVLHWTMDAAGVSESDE